MDFIVSFVCILWCIFILLCFLFTCIVLSLFVFRCIVLYQVYRHCIIFVVLIFMTDFPFQEPTPIKTHANHSLLQRVEGGRGGGEEGRV